MLAALLPGIREVRTPLIAGGIWLLVVWLLTAGNFPEDASNLRGVTHDAWRLLEWAGKPFAFSVSTVAAYLLGVLSLVLSKWLTIAGDILHRTSLFRLSPAYHGESRIDRLMREAISRRLVERIRSDQGLQVEVRKVAAMRSDSAAGVIPDTNIPYFSMEDVFNFKAYLQDARDDILVARQHLVGREPELYAENDRLVHEAQFRIGVSLPLGALMVVLGLRSDPFWLLGVGAAGALWYLGIACSFDARQKLAYALLTARISAPGLERVSSGPIQWSPNVHPGKSVSSNPPT